MAFIVEACQDMSTDLEAAKKERADAIAQTQRLRVEVESLKKVQENLIKRMEALESSD